MGTNSGPSVAAVNAPRLADFVLDYAAIAMQIFEAHNLATGCLFQDRAPGSMLRFNPATYDAVKAAIAETLGCRLRDENVRICFIATAITRIGASAATLQWLQEIENDTNTTYGTRRRQASAAQRLEMLACDGLMAIILEMCNYTTATR